jgi:hypothetical protein
VKFFQYSPPAFFYNLQEKGQEPKESDRFRSALSKKTGEYAEEILSPHFGVLIQFVKEAENMISGNHSELLAKEESKGIEKREIFKM